MAWYNPWSKSGEGSGSEARSSTSKSTPASPPPPPPTTRTPTAGSSKTGPAASPPHTHPHNAIDLSPELFQKPPPAEASPQTLISCLSPTIPLTAFGVGLASGIFTNASKASLVFLAENAHRKPTTMQGWYFYNKTKVSVKGRGGKLWHVIARASIDTRTASARLVLVELPRTVGSS